MCVCLLMVMKEHVTQSNGAAHWHSGRSVRLRMAHVLLPPPLWCALQSWSAPGRVGSLQEPTDLPLWTFLPCTPPWAVLQTDSSDGLALFPVPPSPGRQTSGLKLHSDDRVVTVVTFAKYLMHFVNYSECGATTSHQADHPLCLWNYATSVCKKRPPQSQLLTQDGSVKLSYMFPVCATRWGVPGAFVIIIYACQFFSLISHHGQLCCSWVYMRQHRNAN